MNRKQNKRSARVAPRKIQINKGVKGLTAQAGLIPVVKFLQKQGVVNLIAETVHHQRGTTALYDAVDAIFLPLVAIIGGARSIRAIVTVWSDTILCRAAGWLNIPDETTFGRLFRTFSQRHINDLEVGAMTGSAPQFAILPFNSLEFRLYIFHPYPHSVFSRPE